jgi:hypothetical protein
MANWTMNHVTVYGPEDDIRRFKTFVTGEIPFDFNHILPMPRELEGTQSPSPRPNRRLLDLYGADNWYDWRVEHWGNPWNAGFKPMGVPLLTPAEQIEVTQRSEYSVEYSFFTAWQPPLGVYRALVARFANQPVEITWHFDQDPCEGRQGFLTVEGILVWDYNPFDESGGLATGDAWHERHMPWTDADEPANQPEYS